VSVLSPEAFRQRFAIARFADGGVIVDTINGRYFSLNASAATICGILESAANVDDATRRVGRALNLDEAPAREQIRAVVAALEADSRSSASTEPTPEQTPYQPSPGGGYDLHVDGKPIFHLDAEGRQLSHIGRLQSSVLQVRDLLRNLAPRIAFLHGLVILHGSAVIDGSGVLAMCGVSEAGKTTTARLLSRYGRELLAEDIIVARADQSKIRVFKNGERHLNAWATATAKDFERQEGQVVATDSLVSVRDGSTLELESIWFMDASRRNKADAIVNRALPPTDVVLKVLSNSVIGSVNWRRFLEASTLVASAIRGYETSVPDTLARLEDAIARQRMNSAS
jgi:hypothetical protein